MGGSVDRLQPWLTPPCMVLGTCSGYLNIMQDVLWQQQVNKQGMNLLSKYS